jgi:hypothetical protein
MVQAMVVGENETRGEAIATFEIMSFGKIDTLLHAIVATASPAMAAMEVEKESSPLNAAHGSSDAELRVGPLFD